jgi:glucose-1-phosphate thymidylyltransferase
MPIVLFEDEQVRRLAPLSLARPAFAIRCGGQQLIELARRLSQPLQALVRPHLQPFLPVDLPPYQCDSHGPGANAQEQNWWFNGRIVPSAAALIELRRLLARREPVAVGGHGALVAARLPAGAAPPPELLGGPVSEPMWQRWLAAAGLQPVESALPLFEHPHDVLRAHLLTLGDNLLQRAAHGDYTEIADGVFAADGATLSELVITDTRKGPILLEQNSTVGPFSLLRGPIYLGENARVNEHSAIKDGVYLGATTKVGGEVEASSIEPFSNKQHYGFLGHSLVGSWVNLGAGTANSDLKNSYGSITMDDEGRRVSTGMQFVGCFVGDFAKTAINTGIFTGKTIGVCSMSYGFVATNVPSFVNYARSLGSLTALPVEVAAQAQQRMFARRNVVQEPRDLQLLRDLFELTRAERAPFEPLSTEPLSL